MRVVVDTDKCIGAGQCVTRAADVFDQDETTGLVVLRIERPDEARRAGVEEAVSLCPAQAIELAEGE